MLSRRGFLIGSSLVGSACAAAMRARAETAADGFTVLRARSGEARIAGADRPATPILGFDGTSPGPVLRVRRGEEVKVRLVNELGEPTALHWHGVRLRNAMDGAPPLTQSSVAPGASFDYRFVVPDAGTFWYHASFVSQQQRGLYGALVVAEAEAAADRDNVLVFADWPPDSGAPSRRFTINGAPALDLPARRNERLRLRFINASPTQVMNARIDGHRAVVMALDGEPAEPFAARDNRIVLGPGNRADVFVDALAAPGSIAPIVFTTEGGDTTLIRIVYDGGDAARPMPPGEPMPLPANPLPVRMNFSGALRVTLPIGDAPVPSPQSPLFTATRGRTVMMALHNRDAGEHVVHLHGHHFRLLDRLDDGWKPYWLDTIVVPRRQTTRIAFVADNPGRWLIETQALDGSPAATTWFAVD
jgi:FtsP/CotA-like multicopper oxidase with cupredoxin domain